MKGKGAIFRSKVKWIEKREKPTRYFQRKRTLKRKDDEIVSDFKQINKENENFYTDFYKSNFDIQNKTDIQEKFKGT